MIPASPLWQALAQSRGASSTNLVVLVSINGYSRIFTNQQTSIAGQYPWIVSQHMGSLVQSVSDIDGTSSISELQMTVLDYQYQLSQDFLNFTFEGKKATISVGFPGEPQADYVTLATLIVDHVDSALGNTAYTFVLRDNTLLIQNYSFQTGNSGYPTNNSNPVTILGAPMTILQDALTQAGLSPADINTASINNLNTNVYFGLNFLFNLTYPPRAKDFVENEILKPLGAYWYWNYLGQFTVYSMLPYIEPIPAMILDRTNIAAGTLPVPVQSEDFTDVVTYRMDGDSNGQNFATVIVDAFAPADELYGTWKSKVIQSRGVNSALGGARIAHLCSNNIFRRYGLKPFTLKLDVFMPAMRLEVGDKVTINHPLVPNTRFLPGNRVTTNQYSQLGIQNTLWEVRGRTIQLEKGIVELDLLDVTWQTLGSHEFAPDGTPPYTSATPAEREQYYFIPGPGNTYSNGDPGDIIY